MLFEDKLLKHNQRKFRLCRNDAALNRKDGGVGFAGLRQDGPTVSDCYRWHRRPESLPGRIAVAPLNI